MALPFTSSSGASTYSDRQCLLRSMWCIFNAVHVANIKRLYIHMYLAVTVFQVCYNHPFLKFSQ